MMRFSRAWNALSARQMVEALAAGALSESEFTNWLHERVS
jgi:hypothetical protein